MTQATNRSINFKTVAVPVEHGGWGFLFEPIVLGMVAAPSWSGLCISVAAVAAFLARRPVKLYWKQRGKRSAGRYRGAGVVAAMYAAIAAVALILGLVLAGWQPMLPLLIVSPLFLLFARLDATNQSRSLAAELTGPLALAAVATSVALSAGWQWPGASALWLIATARSIPSVVYVRARLRLERGASFRWTPIYSSQVVFAVLVVWLHRNDLAPAATLWVYALLAVRAFLGLSALRLLRKAKHVGISEIVFGAVYVLAVAIGFRAGW